jgi:ketosteroid isomerase-like protein
MAVIVASTHGIPGDLAHAPTPEWRVARRQSRLPMAEREPMDELKHGAASAKNVDVVTAILAAYAEGWFEATRSFFDPEVEMVRAPDAVQPTVRGFDLVVETMNDRTAMFDDPHSEALEFIEASDHVVVALEEHGNPRCGGVELHQTFYMLYELRNGRVVRFAWFGDRDEALAATRPSE